MLTLVNTRYYNGLYWKDIQENCHLYKVNLSNCQKCNDIYIIDVCMLTNCRLHSFNNPSMPKRYFCTSVIFVIYSFYEKYATSSQHWPFYTISPYKAHNGECHNQLFPLQIKPVKFNLMLNWRIFIFCILGTNGLKKVRIHSSHSADFAVRM